MMSLYFDLRPFDMTLGFYVHKFFIRVMVMSKFQVITMKGTQVTSYCLIDKTLNCTKIK